LEKLVEFLEGVQTSSHAWYIEYDLLCWLSMVVIVPFDLETIDSKKEGEKSLLDKILTL